MELELIAAAKKGRGHEVKTLLEMPDIKVNHRDSTHHRTALHWACEDGHSENVRTLLKHSAIDVNVQGTAGETPFLIACSLGRHSC